MGFRYNFSWDTDKATSNEGKHGVTFEESALIFKDPNALTLYDEDNSHNEERWLTLGMCPNSGVLLVVHTRTEYNENHAEIRIISARKASKNEKKIYRGE
jgi:uncharacterized DUF497 family protein